MCFSQVALRIQDILLPVKVHVHVHTKKITKCNFVLCSNTVYRFIYMLSGIFSPPDEITRSSSQLSVGAVAGISIGIALLVGGGLGILLGVIGIRMWSKRKRSTSLMEGANLTAKQMECVEDDADCSKEAENETHVNAGQNDDQ